MTVRLGTCILLVTAVMTVGTANAGVIDPTLEIYGTSAPDEIGSSNWSSWWSNAHASVHTGALSAGAGHSSYLQLSSTGTTSAPQPAHEALVTGFDSWQGAAGGSGEFGHRIQFIYDVRADGYQSLSLGNLSGIQVYEDGWSHGNDAKYPVAIAYDFSTTLDPLKRVAYAWDGTLVTAGTIEDWDVAHFDNPIYEIVGTFNMAYEVNHGAGEYWYQPGDTPQDTLNRALADVGPNLHSWTGTTTYGEQSVQTTIAFVPEPATLGLMAIGACLLRRRRPRP